MLFSRLSSALLKDLVSYLADPWWACSYLGLRLKFMLLLNRFWFELSLFVPSLLN